MPERERIIDLHNENDPRPEPQLYPIQAFCNNCPWHGEMGVPKGTPVMPGEHLQALVECPDCGCQTLFRMAQQVPNLPYPQAAEPQLRERYEHRRRAQEDALQYWSGHTGDFYEPQPMVVTSSLAQLDSVNRNGNSFSAEALVRTLADAGISPENLDRVRGATERQEPTFADSMLRSRNAEAFHRDQERRNTDGRAPARARGQSLYECMQRAHEEVEAEQERLRADEAAARLMQQGLISRQTAFNALGLVGASEPQRLHPETWQPVVDKEPGSPAQ